MAAESAKLRVRRADDFIVGEHVFVDATVFDDPKSPPEDRFSTTCKEVWDSLLLLDKSHVG